MSAVTIAMAARAALRGVELYRPEQLQCDVNLSDNTNLWGAPPSARAALARVAAQRYPSPYADDLRAALARYVGVATECVVTGCGSDDVIDSAIRAFAEPGDKLAVTDPTFQMAANLARLNGQRLVRVELTAGFDVDVEAMLATKARIIYLCSPNNPTGVPFASAGIERIAREATGLVILDEAYAEFARSSSVPLVDRYPRLLVVRTMSKAFGLAGLRIGYAIGAPSLVAEIAKTRGPFKVSAAAEGAACAVLVNDLRWVGEIADAVAINRRRLAGELSALALPSLPSAANFLLVGVPDALAFAAGLRKRGVAVRAFSAVRHVGDSIRMTIGPWPMMEKGLAAIRAELA